MTKRKTRRSFITVGLTACFSFCAYTGFSQTLQTFTDRNNILIGEQIKLKIKAGLPMGSPLLNKWISVPGEIPHFDIVETGKLDTINFKDGSTAIEQTIIFTSFDSGRWVFPSMPVEFAGAGGAASGTLQTDSFYVNVSYSPPDSTNALRDIKPIIKVSTRDYFWYYIVGAAVLLLLIVFLLYRYFKKKKQLQPAAFVSHLSPFDEAMEEFKKLQQLDLREAVEIKKYHTRLAEITKHYLGRKQQKNLLNKTTGDLLVTLKGIDLSVDSISDLATALRCSDAVKFAKFLPLLNQSEDCMQKMKETVQLIENAKLLKPKPHN